MPSENLEHAIDAIHVQFGDQALVQGTRLPAARPWPTAQPAVDGLSVIGGRPWGPCQCAPGRPRLGQARPGAAFVGQGRSRACAGGSDRPPDGGSTPGSLTCWAPNLDALTLLRPATPAVAGEVAGALAGAGVGFALILEKLPEAALVRLESAAARSGSLVLAVAGGEQRAPAHASSLTLELERVAWMPERAREVGLRSVIRCIKNKLAARAEAELELRYPIGPRLPNIAVPVEVERENAVGEKWATDSAAS